MYHIQISLSSSGALFTDSALLFSFDTQPISPAMAGEPEP